MGFNAMRPFGSRASSHSIASETHSAPIVLPCVVPDIAQRLLLMTQLWGVFVRHGNVCSLQNP